MLKLDSQKNRGILPENFYPIDIDISFYGKTNEAEGQFKKEQGFYDKPFVEMIIIYDDNQYYDYWRYAELIISMVSSYFYAYIAAFIKMEYGEPKFTWMIFYECFFLISTCLKFLRSYIPDGQTVPVKSLSLTVERYVMGEFLSDLIPLIPFPLILPLKGKEQHFYYIKVMRLLKVLKRFDIQAIMQHIIKIHKKNVESMIKADERVGEEMIADINQISTLLVINFVIRISKIALDILTVCYFLGLGWYIFCELLYDFSEPYWERKTPEEIAFKNSDDFIHFYGLEHHSFAHRTITAVYFAFTTLSTVGFGDYAPRSDVERVVCSFILMFGVSIFSYFMGNFIEILEQYQNLNAELDDADNLAKFFGVIKKFNGNVEIIGDRDERVPLKQRIEEHFIFKWNNDQTQAITTEADKLLLEQLPIEVQNKLFCNFLFHEFLINFTQSYFKIPLSALSGSTDPRNERRLMTFDDALYQQYMTQILVSLEPRQVPAETIIFGTNVETHEMFFINSGSIDIGFELNNRTKFSLRLFKGGVVGAFNCTYNKKTIFIYKVKSEFKGLTIRKMKWLSILKNDEFHMISNVVKQNVSREYYLKIKNKVLLQQSKYIKQLKNRADTSQIVGLINLENFLPILANVKGELMDAKIDIKKCGHDELS